MCQTLKSTLEKQTQSFGDRFDKTKDRNEREKIRKQIAIWSGKYKHVDYESEKEVRLICYLGDESGAVRKGASPKEIHFEAINGRLRTYIERPVKLEATLTGLDITLGPRMQKNNVKHWEKVGEWMLAQMGISGRPVRQSELEYIG